MLKGITIKLVSQVEIGIDSFNKAIYDEVVIEVENVLIAPNGSDEILERLNLGGSRAKYTLAIPKNDANIWENQQVEFFGKRFKVIEKPLEGMNSLIPLRWNKKVLVEEIE